MNITVFRNSQQTTVSTVTGEWENFISYTNLYSDNKLKHKIGKYSETYSVSAKGGVYLFKGNACFDDKDKSSVTFGENNISYPRTIYVDQIISGYGKYLNKKGKVKADLGGEIVKYEIKFN
jgi:hypothetical protein